MADPMTERKPMEPVAWITRLLGPGGLCLGRVTLDYTQARGIVKRKRCPTTSTEVG